MEAAARLKVTHQTVGNWIATGRLKGRTLALFGFQVVDAASVERHAKERADAGRRRARGALHAVPRRAGARGDPAAHGAARRDGAARASPPTTSRPWTTWRRCSTRTGGGSGAPSSPETSGTRTHADEGSSLDPLYVHHAVGSNRTGTFKVRQVPDSETVRLCSWRTRAMLDLRQYPRRAGPRRGREEAVQGNAQDAGVDNSWRCRGTNARARVERHIVPVRSSVGCRASFIAGT